jgi:periplasmic divalent cation tolerance protein
MTEAQTDEYIMVYCTCPSEQVATEIGKALVREQLAACVNVVPGITSIYSWKGNMEQDIESLALIKTRLSCFKALQKLVVELHPYELPEVVAVRISDGLPEYLQWINDVTQ